MKTLEEITYIYNITIMAFLFRVPVKSGRKTSSFKTGNKGKAIMDSISNNSTMSKEMMETMMNNNGGKNDDAGEWQDDE
ncbi:MAG: hypothetical protein R3A12_12660 [Ignavibacteria bacterium]